MPSVLLPLMHDQFAALHAATEESARNLAHQLTEGALSPAQFGHEMADLLTEAHTQAVVLGRWHAGDHELEEADDRRFAEAVMDGSADQPGQLDYLAAFVDDLQGDRYRDPEGMLREDAVARRAGLYAGRLAGTGNEVWGLTLPEDAEYWWVLNPEAASCNDCPALEERSPYSIASLPTWPGKAETACLTQCRCAVEAKGYGIGFQLP